MFETHAGRLAGALWIEVSSIPSDYNYVLAWEGSAPPPGRTFVSWRGVEIAADKRLQAEVFEQGGVPTPKTFLVENQDEVWRLVNQNSARQWVLEYPIACGGTGHQLLSNTTQIRVDWPKPFVVQEFVPLATPEVYRLYCVAGKLFGWNARRFPEGAKKSPWVAHARGARYVHLSEPPSEASDAAVSALKAAELFDSFGAVDLLPSARGWLVLEVGTDGLFNHVDREVDSPGLQQELNRRLAEAFWRRAAIKPWGDGQWRPQCESEEVRQTV